MKKSILIGALAVMMLFAFTACEPQATYPTIRNVERIALDGPVFVDGMVFDASRFTVTAFFNDGHSEDVTASAKIDGTKWSDGVVTATLSTATYNGNKYDVTTEKTFDKVPATGYEFSQAAWTIEATADNATKPTKWTYDYASLKAELIESLESGDVTVTASYKDGSIALSVKDIANILSGSTSFEFANAKELADYGLASDKGTVTSTKFVDIPVELSLVVGSGKAVATNISITAEDVTKETSKTEITGIHVLYDVERNSKSIAADVDTLPTLYIGDKVTVTIYKTATLEGEDASTVLESGSEYIPANTDSKLTFTKGAVEITVGKKAVEGTVYYYLNKEIGTVSADVSVPAGENTVVTEAATVTVTLTQNTDTALAKDTVLTGGTDLSSYVKFTASNGLKNLDTEVTDVEYEVYVDNARTYTITDDNQPVWCYVSFDSYGEEILLHTTVNLKTAAGKQA